MCLCKGCVPRSVHAHACIHVLHVSKMFRSVLPLTQLAQSVHMAMRLAPTACVFMYQLPVQMVK